MVVFWMLAEEEKARKVKEGKPASLDTAWLGKPWR